MTPMVSSQSRPKSSHARFFAIFVSALFLTGLLAGLDFAMEADAQGSTPPLRVTGPDYGAKLDKVHGLGNYAYVVLTRTAADTTSQHDFVTGVKVTSTKDTTGFTVDLVENGARTGVFYGGFGFTSGASTAQGTGNHAFFGNVGFDATPKIQVEPGNTVTVQTGSDTTTFTWHPAPDATVEISGPDATSGHITGSITTIGITVRDGDLDTGSGLQDYTQLLKFYSDSDPQGVWVKIVETTATPPTFIGTLQVELTNTPSNDRLFVRNLDRVWASYAEPRNGNGEVQHRFYPTTATFTAASGGTDVPGAATWTFLASETGNILVDRPAEGNTIHYFGDNGALHPSGRNRMVITIADADFDTTVAADTINVLVKPKSPPGNVCGTGDAAARPITAVEDTGRSGLFHASLDFGELSTLVPPLASGDSIHIAYCDNGNIVRTYPASGSGRTIRWTDTGPATIEFTLPTVPNTNGMLIGNAQHDIVLVDRDANRRSDTQESVVVKVKSSTDPTSGATVTLSESIAEPGRFLGKVSFSTTGPSVGSTLHVADGDHVVVEYDDAWDGSDKPRLTRSEYVLWRQPTLATITTDHARYYAQYNSGLVTTAKVTLVDPDRNNPLKQDTVTVSAAPDGNPAATTSFTLREIGINSGIFNGTLRFSLSSSLPPPAGIIPVATDTQTSFTVYYLDPFSPQPGTATVQTPLLVFDDDPPQIDVRFEETLTLPAAYRDMISLIPSSNPGGAERDFVIAVYGPIAPTGYTVTVSSGSCSKDINLLQGGENPNRYAGTVTFNPVGQCNTAGASTVIVAADADVKLHVAGTQVEKVFKTRVDSGSSLIFTNQGGNRVHRTGSAETIQYVRVSDPQANVHRAYRDIVSVTLENQAQAETNGLQGFSMDLLETSPDSGVFTGSFRMSHKTPLGDLTLPGRAPPGGDMSLMYRPTGTVSDDGYGISDAIIAQYQPAPGGGGQRTTGMRWFASTDAVVEVERDSIGTSSLQIALRDYDGLSGRVFQRQAAIAGQRTYAFSTPDYIFTSELVYMNRTATGTGGQEPAPNSPLPGQVAQVNVGMGSAAERIADANGDGLVNCADVRVRAFNAPNAGPPNPGGSYNNVAASCLSVNPATGIVRVGACPTQCTAHVTFQYRAAFVNTCPTSNGAALDAPDRYRRESNGITFCGALQVSTPDGDPNRLFFDYAPAKRTVSVSGGGETETATLTWTGNGAADRRFVGQLPIETTLTTGNGRLMVGPSTTSITASYADRERTPDGTAGSASVSHFRHQEGKGTWRAGQTGALAFMDPQLTATIQQVYGPGLGVQVTDPDRDRSGQSDVIKASVVGDGVGLGRTEFTLFETGANTGVFRGVANVAAASGQGTLQVEYVDESSADGTRRTVFGTVPWAASKTATLTLNGLDLIGSDARFRVMVVDPDANTNPNAETISVLVRSTRDPVGEVISLTETTPGSFSSGDVTFETSVIANNGKILAREGDRVWAEYLDPLNDAGFTQVLWSNNIQWNEETLGQIRVDTPFYIGLDPTGPGTIARAIVQVSDPDANINPQAVDKIGPGPVRLGASTASSPTLTLVETGANTGVFIGTADFAAAGNSEVLPGTRAKIPLSSTTAENDFKVFYTDPEPTGSTVREATAKWYPPGTGIVLFDKEGYNSLENSLRVTLYDGNEPASFTVNLSSEQAGGALGFTKTDFTVDRPGVYTKSFMLTDTGTSGRLRVQTIDTIVARYTDQAPTFAVRTTTAAVAVGDESAPITQLITTPANGAGENGWFLQRPTVSFVADENVKSTFYRIGSAAAPTQFTTGFTLDEGVHEIRFWSVDLFDNEETPKNRTVRVDLNNPTGTITDLTSASRPAGAIELKWTATSDKTPLNFGSYKVYRGAAQASNLVGNSTTETFTDTPPADGSFTYYVAVADSAGRVNLNGSKSVTGVSDRVAPRLDAFTVTPTTVNEAAGQTSVSMNAQVVTADLGDTRGVHLKVTDPFGVAAAPQNLTRTGTTNTWTGTFDGFSACGIYRLFGAAFDAAGNEGGKTVNVTYDALDREAPLVLVSATSVEQGTSIAVNVTENCRGIASLSYRIDGGTAQAVSVTDNPLRRDFTLDTTDLSIGTHTLEVTASDANGTANTRTYSFSLIIVEPGTTPPPDGGPETPAPTIQPVSFLTEATGALQFRVGSGSPLTALTVSFDGGTPLVLLSSWANQQTVIEASVAGLQPGAHTATIVATNAGGTTTRDVAFNVLDAGVPLPPASVVVQKGPGGFPQITWTASPSSSIGGYLIHRASSPSEVIADVGADTSTYTDRTADAKTAYTYAVTAYGPNGEGKLALGTLSTDLSWFDKVQAQSFETDAELDDGGFFANYWWVLLIIAAVIVAVSLAYVYRERLFGKGGQQEAFADEYPDEAGAAFGVERHSLRCPNCTHEFSVSGQKPIVTTCPNCGKKGILR